MRLKGTRKGYCYRMKEIKHSFEDEETISGTKTCKHVSYMITITKLVLLYFYNYTSKVEKLVSGEKFSLSVLICEK